MKITLSKAKTITEDGEYGATIFALDLVKDTVNFGYLTDETQEVFWKAHKATAEAGDQLSHTIETALGRKIRPEEFAGEFDIAQLRGKPVRIILQKFQRGYSKGKMQVGIVLPALKTARPQA